MATFKKKPITIEAFKWTGGYPAEKWGVDALKRKDMWFENGPDGLPLYLKIRTLEGVMTANRRDYIIRGIAGEIYPCKPEIFEATYEEVIEDD